MSSLIVRRESITDYNTIWQMMRRFTDGRNPSTCDEIWWVQHDPVFTLGQAGKAEHILAAGDIPVIKSDRGGQVTYHGPGQLVGYLLLDIRRMGIGVRKLVTTIELAIIEVLGELGVDATANPSAPGVYIEGKKIAALGLRVRKGCSFHGLSLNVDMDLSPFSRINPCGFEGLEVTQIHNLGIYPSLDEVASRLTQSFQRQFGYDSCLEKQWVYPV